MDTQKERQTDMEKNSETDTADRETDRQTGVPDSEKPYETIKDTEAQRLLPLRGSAWLFGCSSLGGLSVISAHRFGEIPMTPHNKSDFT